ncbi:hypothetical protein GCM10017607_28880 [Microbacterium thalassium]|nr:hypothetical protein GCM10017607_28880 [Microbacterium thalassium]
MGASVAAVRVRAVVMRAPGGWNGCCRDAVGPHPYKRMNLCAIPRCAAEVSATAGRGLVARAVGDADRRLGGGPLDRNIGGSVRGLI